MTEVVETPKPEEPKVEAPKINPQVPLSRQIDKMIQATPERKDEKEETPKIEEKPSSEDTPKEEPKEQEPTKFEPEDEPDIAEPTELPPVAKYILDNLPQIQVVGHQGEDGKDKTFAVKRIEDLPDDFEFVSRRAELVFNAAIAAQEVNARELLQKYRQEENNNKLIEIQNQEALDVESDVKQLQKEGLLGKFPDTNDPKFNDDPAVKEANAIYSLFQKTNASYAQTKKTYRISYRDAADKYYAAKARQTSKEPIKTPEKTPEKSRTEREEVAQKISAPSGTSSDKQRIRLPRGATQQDILKLYRAGKI